LLFFSPPGPTLRVSILRGLFFQALDERPSTFKSLPLSALPPPWSTAVLFGFFSPFVLTTPPLFFAVVGVPPMAPSRLAVSVDETAADFSLAPLLKVVAQEREVLAFSAALSPYMIGALCSTQLLVSSRFSQLTF